MASIEEAIFSIGSLVEHERDFAFTKNNGEIANHIRGEFSAGGVFSGLATLEDIFIDEEDDIAVRTDKGAWYFTPSNVSVVGWPTRFRDLEANAYPKELSKVMQVLFGERKPLGAELFSIRLFFLQSCAPDQDLSALADLAHTPLLSILGDRIPRDGAVSRLATTFRRGDFVSTLELELEGREVQLRYAREARAKAFESYSQFLEGAQLAAMAEDLRPFLETICSEPLPGREL